MQILQGEPRLLDRVRAAVRMRHYSRRTEKAYAAWIRRFIVCERTSAAELSSSGDYLLGRRIKFRADGFDRNA